MKSFRGPVDGDIALYLQGWNDGMRGRPVKYRSTVIGYFYALGTPMQPKRIRNEHQEKGSFRSRRWTEQ